MLKGPLGGLLGGAAAGSVISGGLGDLLKQLQQGGQGDTANSWVGKGPNKAISPGDLAKRARRRPDQLARFAKRHVARRTALRAQPVSAAGDRPSDAGRAAADRERSVGPDLRSSRILFEENQHHGRLIWIIIVGFVAGIIARLLSPGPNNPTGFILTTVLGIVGAFLATWIGQAIGHYGPDQGAGFITATIGALVVLFIWNRLVASGDDQGFQPLTPKPSLRANGSARTRGPMTGSAKQSRNGQKAGLLRR